MPRRRIGSVTPVWSAELFVKPHFQLLSLLDRQVVFLQSGPFPSYLNEHGYPLVPDRSENMIRTLFPHVEIYKSQYDPSKDFSGEIYNEGLVLMQDCDIVLRLDPDMIWRPEDFLRMMQYIDETDADCYRMDFSQHTINYYMTGDFEHGLKDGMEHDIMAVSPQRLFTGILDYPAQKTLTFDLPDWMCYHFRGWGKPKSVPADWHLQPRLSWYVENFGNHGQWWVCPDDIRQTMQAWLDELAHWKSS